ncbi:MAG: Epi-isozizaene 5-monooxygenase/(E)-beta-farnesene synthase, partial [Nocardioides sp.]|nr:Epi-isozizaene 5-monooxygenase/(E)-beta-farnesene synthase [Nocardioides sp.]
MTTVEDSRAVLTSPVDFVLPFDVSRQHRGRGVDTGRTIPTLAASAVAVGRQTFIEELTAAEPGFVGTDVDTLSFLRRPVSRSTTAALVPEADAGARDAIADLVLGWIDSLAPVISADRPPRRWSRARRTEQDARQRLTAALADLGCAAPAARATALA